jgi:HPt (histidine-containing phosphotransfer) domain-containing protein
VKGREDQRTLSPDEQEDGEKQVSNERHTDSSSHSEQPSILFDRAALLERLMGDEELLDEVIDIYLEDIPPRIEAIRSCLEAGDAEGVVRQAHTIKGASANAGCDSLRDLAAKMEQAGKVGDLESMSAGMDELVVIFEAFRSIAGASSRDDGDGDGGR